MKKEFWYITDEQIKIARENGACEPALTWAEKERDWRKISADWLGWDAENTKMCPVEALIELSKDSDWEIRYSVARHPNTPVEILCEFSKDPDWCIRSSVAQNLNTPPEILTELSKDSDSGVRYSISRHPSTPTKILVDLSCDKYADVRNSAIQNLNNSINNI